MASLNKVQLIGHLGADPEVRTFPDGGRVANLRLATSESWKDRATGERKERTEWHSIAIGGDGLVDVVKQYCRKGSKIYVEGQLRTRKWQDRDGNDRYTTEIAVGLRGQLVLLGDPSGGGGGRGGAPAQTGGAAGTGHAPGFGNGKDLSGSANSGRGFDDELDDDVPF